MVFISSEVLRIGTMCSGTDAPVLVARQKTGTNPTISSIEATLGRHVRSMCIATSNKGIATRSKDATRGSWHYY